MRAAIKPGAIMDDRPALKQDVDDLKNHIDQIFEAQSKGRAEMYEKLNKGAQKDIEHSLKIENIEKRLDRFFKGLSTVGLGVIGKIVYDIFSKGG